MFTHFLPKLLAKITGKPRYLPKIFWSDKSFVHNAFRFYEMIFWRKYGVRAEVSADWFNNERGELKVVYSFYTLEGFLAHMEGLLRKRMYLGLKPVNFFIPKLVAPSGIRFDNGVLFAIAFDAVNNSDRWGTGSSSTTTISLTVAGSDRFIMGATSTNQAVTPTAMAYNSDSLTLIDSVTGGDAPDIYAYGLIAPDTGTNNLVITLSTSTIYMFGKAISYTGVDQTDAIGATFEVTHESSTTADQNITTTVANSLLVDFVSGQNFAYTITADDGQTIRSNTTVSGGLRFIVADEAAASVTTYTNGYTMSSATGLTLLTIEVLPLGATIVTPSAQALALTLNSPSLLISSSVFPDSQNLSLSQPAATVTGSANITPDALALTITLETPTITGTGATFSASAISMTSAVLAPSTLLDWTVAPSSLSLTSASLSPSFILGTTVMPEALDLTLTINQIGNRWNPRIPISTSWTPRVEP